MRLNKVVWNEVKFIDRDPHCFTRRDKEAIHVRLHPNKTNRDIGIEIPEACIPAIKKHNSRRAVRQPIAKEQLTKTAKIEMRQSQLLKTNQSQQSIMRYKVTHNQSTSSPEED